MPKVKTTYSYIIQFIVKEFPDEFMKNINNLIAICVSCNCAVSYYKCFLNTISNTEERIVQNIYIHNSNRNYKKLTTTTILIKKRIGIGYYKNYKKQCPGLEFHLIPKLISWAGLRIRPKKF